MSKCTKFGAPTLYGDRMKQTAIYHQPLAGRVYSRIQF